jgi:hypothetical protein
MTAKNGRDRNIAIVGALMAIAILAAFLISGIIAMGIVIVMCIAVILIYGISEEIDYRKIENRNDEDF